MHTFSAIALTASLWTVAVHADALTINDINLADFAFDITSYNAGSSPDGLSGDAIASGTSGGIDWTISPTALWSARTTTNGSFQFTSLPNTTDNLHPSLDYTITFASPVQTLLVALSNDNTNDSIDFGLIPKDFIGLTLVGTQVFLNSTQGALILFENINSLTVSNSNSNGSGDGYDLAFHVVSSVPNPSSWTLFALGMAVLAPVLRWRRTASPLAQTDPLRHAA
jgi:hypothetical protein